MDVREAIANVVGWTEMLADLPPPGPGVLHDDVGFSGATNGPMRNYLAQVHYLGPDQVPLDAHFAAVSYLRQHSRRQINREQWETAFRTLRDAWRNKLRRADEVQGSRSTEKVQAFTAEKAAKIEADAEGKKPSKKKVSEEMEVTPEERAARLTLRFKAEGTDPASNFERGTTPNDGSWELLSNGWVKFQPTYRRNRDFSLRGDDLQAAGFTKNVDYKWTKRGTHNAFTGKDELDFVVNPHAISRMADYMQEGWPVLSAAMRAFLPKWLEGAPEAPVRPEGPTANEPQRETAPPQPEWTGTAEEGRTRAGIRWKWDKNNPDTVEIALPYQLSQLLRNNGVVDRPIDRGKAGEKDWWNLFRTEDMRHIGEIFAANNAPVIAEVIQRFHGVWARPPDVDPEAEKRSRNLVRRFKFMMHPQVRSEPEQVESALAKVAHLIHRIKPGDLEVDLGAYGSWKVIPNADGSIGKDADIRVYMPFALKHWREGLRHVSLRKDAQGRWYDSIPLKKAPEVARKLDLFSPPLALSIRIALLTETLRECYELEEMAGAASIDEIADPNVREQARAIVQRVYRHLNPDRKLYPYQEVGVAFATLTDFRCMIGDSMGLGKTLQSLGCLAANVEKLTPALVVAPATVTYGWEREGKAWTNNLNFVHITTKTNLDQLGEGDVGIISWGLVSALYERLESREFKCLVVDESHYGKHSSSTRTKSIIALSQSIPHRLLLSGTAMENKPEELWAQLHVVAPEVFTDAKEFKARFGSTTKRRVKVKGQDVDFADDRGTDPSIVLAELREILRCFMIRRLKSEVMLDLPEKTRQYIWSPLPPDLQAAYNRVEANMEAWLCSLWRKKALLQAVRLVQSEGKTIGQAVDEINGEAKDFSEAAGMALVAMGHLRRIVGEAKATVAVEQIENFLEQNDTPLIVFVEHQKPLKTIQAALSKMKVRGKPVHWTYIDGSVSAKERGNRIADFQGGKYDVMIGTRAMAEGATLTRASDTLFVERWWTPSKEEQAEDRIHRPGQKNAANIRYLMAPNTMDEHISELVDNKRALIESVMRGEKIDTTTADERFDAAKGLVASMLNRMVLSAGACRITSDELKAALKGVFPPGIELDLPRGATDNIDEAELDDPEDSEIDGELRRKSRGRSSSPAPRPVSPPPRPASPTPPRRSSPKPAPRDDEAELRQDFEELRHRFGDLFPELLDRFDGLKHQIMGRMWALRESHAEGAAGVPFAKRFDEVFDRLRAEARVNLVPLDKLRAELSQYDRQSFDDGLYKLRRANEYVLETFDGRHGKLTPSELAAAIEEDGRRFVYVSRREHARSAHPRALNQFDEVVPGHKICDMSDEEFIAALLGG